MATSGTVVPDHVTVMPSDVGAFGEAIGPVDYGCVRRYRHRRLVTYLWLNGFRGALRGMLNETDAIMSVPHLSRLVQQGLWDDAISYLSRFLRPVSHPQSDEAQVLTRFLWHHKAFASMVAGENNRDLNYFNQKYNTRYRKHDGSVSHDDLRMRSIVLSLLNSPQVRASLDWERVRHKASRVVQDLAYKAPELKDLALFPGGSMMPHDVLPIGFRSRRRRYVKQQNLPGPKTLTKIFLWTKKRLPSSTCSHKLNRVLTEKSRKWVVDILDESLQAGSLGLQSSGKKGVPGATVSHTMSNTLTDLTRNSVSGTSSLVNADALVSLVSQIMSGTSTIPAKLFGVTAVSQTMNLTSHAENCGISAVTNAGTSKLLSSGNSNLRKHPRTEEIIFEQVPHPKMQRTSGAFGGACLQHTFGHFTCRSMASSGMAVPDHVTVMPDDVGAFGEAIGPVDYGCVRRYRHRRLVTYLWVQGFRETLRGMLNETDAIMSVPHLSWLVQQGLWDNAISYLSRFLRPVSHPQSDEAQVLTRFLWHHKAFASMVAGGNNRDLNYFNQKYNTRYRKHDGSVSHNDLRMRSIVLSLLNSPQVRASLDLERVRHKASRIVQDLAYKAPELKDLALFPGGSMMPHDVLPIGFRSRRRRYIKQQNLPGPKTLTKIFLWTKKRLPSSTCSHKLNGGMTEKTRKWVADILDESLQAGSLGLQSSVKKGDLINVPGATVSHTMSNTSTDLTRKSVSVTSSLVNAGILSEQH